MFEPLRSPNTGGFIPASPVSLLFYPGPNLSVSCRQTCPVDLRNAVSGRGIREELALPFTLNLPQAVPRYGCICTTVTDSRSQ